MKFKIKSTHYMKDEHDRWSREHTKFAFKGADWCCEDLKAAYGAEILAIENFEDKPELRTLESYDSEDGWRDYYDRAVRFCPFCGSKVEWEVIERAKVEYECKEEIIPEQKKVYCTPKETVLNSSQES